MHDKNTTHDPIAVKLANHEHMYSTHIGTLPLPHIPPAGTTAYTFTELGNTSLLSLGQLCDSGCTAQFDSTTCTVTHTDGNVLHGTRNPTTNGLWTVTIPEHHQSLSATATGDTQKQMVEFAHAALFSPTLATLQQAIHKGILPDFPGLTKDTLRRHPPPTDATQMGHLDNRRQHQQPTPNQENDDPFPIAPDDGERSHLCYVAAIQPKRLVYSDQTGRLPVTSNQGNQYLVVAYDYDSNNIMLRPIKNRSTAELTKAMASIHDTLTKGGCKPKYHRMDNECPEDLKTFLQARDITVQLTAPHDHRANAAERAIRTAKNHITAGWASMHDDFPMQLWDKTIPQAELTLNLLRGSRINPKLSAWEQLHGRYDFNRTPIAPPGTKVLAHLKPDQRQTWAFHASEAWYIGPAMDHYRCYRVWITKSRQERIVNQLSWLHHRTAIPTISKAEQIRDALDEEAK